MRSCRWRSATPPPPELWRTTGQELLASNRGQKRLIDALLTLASSERGLDRREPVDLSAIADSVLLDRRADGRSVGLRVEADVAPAPVDGDPRLLESLVANLVDNAIAHNVEGGRVDVVTACEDGRAVLTVANTGPAIPPGEVERLFQPFQRLDTRRTHRGGGHGLGLAIVRAIATAHGAAVEARPVPGGGVSIEVVFPRAAQPTSNRRCVA